MGEFTWTGWDYIGELGGAPYPAWQNTSGDIDSFGFRRPVSYWREIVFGLRSKPYIAVRPPEAHGTPRMFGPWKFTDAVASWTWEVVPDTPMTVEVYAPSGQVELRLDGKLVGSVQTSEHYALFEVPYEAGTLEAITEAGECWTLTTADVATARVVTKDYAYNDWVFCQAHVEDAAGNWILDSGLTWNCSRKGYELVAAGSAASTPADFGSGAVRMSGQGALAIYKAL